MTHHQKLYPPSDYKSDTYRDAGKDSTTKFFLAITIPMIVGLIVLGVFLHMPLYLMAIALVEALALGWLHDYLHDAFHIKNHKLSKVPVLKHFFVVWDDLHYIHHVDMTKNYGIFTFFWDKVFGTFEL
jgi:sterol desaturase/sphingolipid hydroxylase (fatty acid hydroxylase superfamily)